MNIINCISKLSSHDITRYEKTNDRQGRIKNLKEKFHEHWVTRQSSANLRSKVVPWLLEWWAVLVIARASPSSCANPSSLIFGHRVVTTEPPYVSLKSLQVVR
ncbi:hypothetical protein PoB_001964900 [Plakobranchus ocellatus]|uniref:Uncharacterized protein n=1 Tax=Plakobranchus ocellatus TaxID=259542 RepID=A0AAV3ZGX8_9GAST|nr:hypothetical protein PoB_001964900 [Plakobranchus ocellatus]